MSFRWIIVAYYPSLNILQNILVEISIQNTSYEDIYRLLSNNVFPLANAEEQGKQIYSTYHRKGYFLVFTEKIIVIF